MKHLASLLLLSTTITLLIAQNPVSRRSVYNYDFGTDSYILSSEFVRNHNQMGQAVFSSFTRWYMWQDSLIEDYLFDTEYSYHPNGKVASSLNRNFQQDTLQRGHYLQYDIHENIIKDSSYFRESEEREHISVRFNQLVYDEQDRIIEELVQYWSNDQPDRQDVDYNAYLYNANGCLEQHTSGLNKTELFNRITYTYDNNCRITHTLGERWDFTLREWTNYNQRLFAYQAHADSTVISIDEQIWSETSQNWFTTKEIRQVLDKQGRELKYRTFDAGGRQTLRQISYNAQGDIDFQLTSNRSNPSATWVHQYKYQLLNQSATNVHFRQEIGWDTLRNAYRVYADINKEMDQQGRLIEEIRIDSIWHDNQYNHNHTIWRYNFEDYCDGLTKTRIIKRGEAGLSPQPVSRTDYSYLYKSDCASFGSSFEMTLSPNPAQHRLILESEMLQMPDVRVQIVDHLGRVHFSDAPGERQSRYTVPISSLQMGTYILQLSSPTESISRTFIKY